MAEARVSVDLDQFNCPICLDLLKDPVSINCGHSFCMACIKTKWDQDDQSGVYSCPMCRTTFSPRPVLGRNTMLAAMVENLKKAHVAEESLAGPGDVECDVCIDRKQKAIKTCLVCLASYCGAHFRLHNELDPGNRHEVVEASGRLKDRVCLYHNRLKELYCRDEEECVCSLCAVDYHQGHTIVSNQQERFAKQDQANLTKYKDSQRIQQAENLLEGIRQAVQSFRISTQEAISDSEKNFTEMIHSMERARSEVREKIKAQEKAEVQYAEGIQKQLELEIVMLKKRDTELDELSRTKDHTYFLQTIGPLCASPMFDPLPGIAARVPSFETVKTPVAKLREQVKGSCTAEVARLSTAVTNMKMIHTPVPFIRDDFLKYFHQPVLELNSVSCNLGLSEKNSKLTCNMEHQIYPKHPERYTNLAQALCKQGLRGRSYWEVEWDGPQVYIGVSYKGVDRKTCSISVGFGHNNKSWSLCCSHSGSYFIHADIKTDVLGPVSSRIGVYLDHRAGTLSFYSVSNMMTLLHSVKANFREPLYPGFWVFDGSSLRICQCGEKLSPEICRREDSNPANDLYGHLQFTILKCHYVF